MPRRLQIPKTEAGLLDLYLIYSYGGKWESPWEVLQSDHFDIPVIEKQVLDHALWGWTKPLIDKLDRIPAGHLRKLQDSHKLCREGPNLKGKCPFYTYRKCTALSKPVLWCFTPDGVEAGNLAADVIRLWSENVYVLVVEESTDG